LCGKHSGSEHSPRWVCWRRLATLIMIVQWHSRGLAPRSRLIPMSQNVCLSRAWNTSSCPSPNSPACSPRRQRGQVFRALFPACDGSLRIVRPSYPGLRPGNNGDRMTRGRRGIGIGRMGPQNPLHGSDTLPPLGWQTGATPSGKNSRRLAPRCGRDTRESKRHHIRIETLPPARARGLRRNDHLWDLTADCEEPCIPLRSDSFASSSMVKGPSWLENQNGRMYFRSDPVKYCSEGNTPRRKRCQNRC